METRQNLWGGSGSAWQRASRSERFNCALYTVATPERSDGCKHHHNRRADTDTSHRAASKWCFLELAERGHRTSCCSALARLSPKLTDPSWSSSGREPWSSKAWGQTHTHTHTHTHTRIYRHTVWRPESRRIKYTWQRRQIYFCVCICKYSSLGFLHLAAQQVSLFG